MHSSLSCYQGSGISHSPSLLWSHTVARLLNNHGICGGRPHKMGQCTRCWSRPWSHCGRSWFAGSPRALLGHCFPGNDSSGWTNFVPCDCIQTVGRWTQGLWTLGSVPDFEHIRRGSSYVGLPVLWTASKGNVRERGASCMGLGIYSSPNLRQETHPRDQAHTLKPRTAFSIEEKAQGQAADLQANRHCCK